MSMAMHSRVYWTRDKFMNTLNFKSLIRPYIIVTLACLCTCSSMQPSWWKQQGEELKSLLVAPQCLPQQWAKPGISDVSISLTARWFSWQGMYLFWSLIYRRLAWCIQDLTSQLSFRVVSLSPCYLTLPQSSFRCAYHMNCLSIHLMDSFCTCL